MTLKRFFLVLVLFYSFLSLAAPSFAPVRILSLSGLLLSEPWERLFSSLFGAALGPSLSATGGGKPGGVELKVRGGAKAASTEGDGSGGRRSESGKSEESSSWWRFVFPPARLRGGRVPLGGRVCSPLSASTTRARLDMGPNPPVRRDDPVVYGNVLVGFVGSIESDGRVNVIFIGDRSSRLVGAEIGEGIAGGRISFVVGGGLVSRTGVEGAGREAAAGRMGVMLRYPSTRFGLTTGARVYTSPRFNRPDVPGGYYLGRVSLLAPVKGESRACVMSPLSGNALERLAVLVPSDRPGVSGRPPVPDLGIRRVAVSFSPPPGFLTRTAVLRVWAGIEKGLDAGGILVAQGFTVGRISGSGILASRAELFLKPGKEATFLRIAKRGPEAVRLRVLERSDSLCTISVSGEGVDLSPGSRLYLSGGGCSGSEVFPVCRVLGRMGEGSFLVRCGGIRGKGERGLCLLPQP